MEVVAPPDKQQWYYHPDHLGSTSMVTSENGQLAEHTHYFPYGEVWLQERPSTPVPYLFSSKEFDPETGLYDFGSRYLNPRLAQWMTTDPALGDYSSRRFAASTPDARLSGRSPENHTGIAITYAFIVSSRLAHRLYSKGDCVMYNVDDPNLPPPRLLQVLRRPRTLYIIDDPGFLEPVRVWRAHIKHLQTLDPHSHR
jgi:RHS repeat-associated protein